LSAVRAAIWTVVALLAACTAPSSPATTAGGDNPAGAPARPAVSNPALLEPFAATEIAPDEYRVVFSTTKGDFTVAVHRAWAPNGADRFYNLVKLGFFDDAAFFRAIAGFMVQFGLNGHPDVSKAWRTAPIKDDPVTHRNAKGTITFAMRGPNTRTTQVFINYNDNSAALDAGGFAPFGEVVEGMEVVESLHTGYGEGEPKGTGPHQPTLEREGNDYLRRRFPDLDYVTRAALAEP
jgi:peptidyl-prolyl cis-trans isomerase A (cyclophilin A)